jgi:uncharacterized protein (DUF1800 family)
MRDATIDDAGTLLDDRPAVGDDSLIADILPLSRIVTITTPAAALAACGGGDDAGAPPVGSGPPPPPPPPTITGQQAARFLSQSAMGSTKADIDRVRAAGYAGWLDEQFARPRAISHWDWMTSKGYADAANRDSENGFNNSMWRQLISGDDQLRQRVGMALLDILVISINGLDTNWRAFAAAAYVDILMDNAFGNYRTLLERVSLSTAMGLYLTFLGNRKANPATGSSPDENYAREIMQLFSIGLVRLNADGTPQSGVSETYTQDDVSGLARVFTGFTYASSDSSTPARHQQPMINNAANHETGVKTFLGGTIPAGATGQASLTQGLDIIFAHPNVPPFISRQLIQRLVTSNPSPGYVSRVAAVFVNNGSGVRGDLRAVVRAILLDSEARDDNAAAGANFGKLRAPINRLTAWARGFGVTSPSDVWGIGDTSSPANRLAQSPGRAPSVFNFFRPGYTPPNTSISAGGLVGPEFQITTEPSVVAYINYMQSLVSNGTGDTRADYTALLTLAPNAQNLVDEVNLILGAGLSSATLGTIRTAIEGIDATSAAGQNNRVYAAILLTLAAPEFIAQK